MFNMYNDLLIIIIQLVLYTEVDKNRQNKNS